MTRSDIFTPGAMVGLIELTAAGQAGGRGRGSDEFDDGFVIHLWPTSPVPRYEREAAILHLVPLAGAGRTMQDRHAQCQLVGQLLKFDLPQADVLQSCLRP